MFKTEAEWLQRTLASISTDRLSPLLSVGSGGAARSEGSQPWIGDLVYRPLEARGVTVLHHELHEGPGIDVAGDLQDPAFLDRLHRLGTRSILCCNVLEHLEHRAVVTKALSSAVPPGGCLLVTVPRRFPYHPDPIDTMFRPDSDALAAEFPDLALTRSAEVKTGTLVRYLLDATDVRASLAQGVRVAVDRLRRRPPPQADGSRSSAPPPDQSGNRPIELLFRQTLVTCALFEKPTHQG